MVSGIAVKLVWATFGSREGTGGYAGEEQEST
jgi:hypothetical protein